MSEPTVIVTIHQIPGGGYAAELAGHPEVLSAPDFGSLLDKIRDTYQGNGTVEPDEDDVYDESFQRDLEQIIKEDRELLDRLAR